MTGAAMGILTVVGHATDSLLNAVGLAALLYARRKVGGCLAVCDINLECPASGQAGFLT